MHEYSCEEDSKWAGLYLVIKSVDTIGLAMDSHPVAGQARSCLRTLQTVAS